MNLEIERIYEKNQILRGIEDGFNTVFGRINNEITGFNIEKLIDEVGFKASWLDLSEYFSDEIKGHIYDLVKAYKKMGTYESYTVLLKSFFGEDSIITFDNSAPAVLNISIQPVLGNKSLETVNNEIIQTINALNILTKNSFDGLSNAELGVLLQKIKPAGIIVNYTII